MNRIQNGDTERIFATALDYTGVTVTGLSDMLIEIVRVSDDYYLDFSDNTFKTSGWTTRQQQMTELDSTNSAGVYYYDFNTTGFSDDVYFIRVTSATAFNVPLEGSLHVGGYIDNIDSSISAIATSVQKILGLSHENYRIKSSVYDDNHNLTSATFAIYPDASNCNADTNAIATYTLTSTYDGNNNLSTYKVVKA